MDEGVSDSIIRKSVELASEIGVRVVAMAYGPAKDAHAQKGFTFVGWQAMLDPPREGVQAAIARLSSARVKTVMITGDAESTARSIAIQLGLNVDHILTGKDIDSMSTEQLAARIDGVNVFARTTPRHKMSIIAAFQTNGNIVAMTGDGGQLRFTFT